MLATAQFDVVIVGAGMVGATCACLLAQLCPQWSIGIVDPASWQSNPNLESSVNDEQYHWDARVSALNLNAIRLLSELGIWSQMAPASISHFVKVAVRDGAGTADLVLDQGDLITSPLGYIVTNAALVLQLRRRVSELPQIKCLSPRSLATLQKHAQGWRLQLLAPDGGYAETITASLVIAADGSHSKVRSLLNFPVRQWSYQQRSVVAVVATELSHQRVARQIFYPSGPLAFLPLLEDPNENKSSRCAVVWSIDTMKSQSLLALNDADFMEALAQAFEYQLGNITAVGPRKSFPLQQLHATEYCDQGIVLIGDAAHVVHPLAGQGVNIGLMDALVLTHVLSQAKQKQIDWSSLANLRCYQRQRKTQHLLWIALIETFYRLFKTDSHVIRLARNYGMRYLQQMPWVKQFIIRFATGLEQESAVMDGLNLTI